MPIAMRNMATRTVTCSSFVFQLSCSDALDEKDETDCESVSLSSLRYEYEYSCGEQNWSSLSYIHAHKELSFTFKKLFAAPAHPPRSTCKQEKSVYRVEQHFSL